MTFHVIINGDCLDVLRKMPNESIHLVVTSPPYNVGIEYDEYNDSKSWEDYFSFMDKVIQELRRVLVPGGRICWNVMMNVRRKDDNKRTNLMQQFKNIFDKYFVDMGDIIWWEETMTKRTAWGSWCSPSSPYIQMSLECIMVYAKDTTKLEGENTDLNKKEFMEWVTGIWRFNNLTHGEMHAAPFPSELPRRCIKLFSWVGNTILDPFAGSGTTMLMARTLNRNSVGIELSKGYCERMKGKSGYGQQSLTFSEEKSYDNNIDYKFITHTEEADYSFIKC